MPKVRVTQTASPAGRKPGQKETLIGLGLNKMRRTRELEEEIGMRAVRLDLLGHFLNSPGFCDEESYLFLARDRVDFLEITADHYLDASPEKDLELALLADHFPLIPHGLNLSLGLTLPRYSARQPPATAGIQPLAPVRLFSQRTA